MCQSVMFHCAEKRVCESTSGGMLPFNETLANENRSGDGERG